jgi:hypothetical protein
VHLKVTVSALLNTALLFVNVITFVVLLIVIPEGSVPDKGVYVLPPSVL